MTAYEKYQTLPYDTIEERHTRDAFYEQSSILMDPDLRKQLKEFMKPTTEPEFLEGYCIFHELEKGVVFEGADL